eukprot:7510066-Pyramimonas_sp.AAC.1
MCGHSLSCVGTRRSDRFDAAEAGAEDGVGRSHGAAGEDAGQQGAEGRPPEDEGMLCPMGGARAHSPGSLGSSADFLQGGAASHIVASARAPSRSNGGGWRGCFGVTCRHDHPHPEGKPRSFVYAAGDD